MSSSPWGTDGVVSMPEALPSTDVAKVEFDGLCFTPDGIRFSISTVDREELLLSAYRPETEGD